MLRRRLSHWVPMRVALRAAVPRARRLRDALPVAADLPDRTTGHRIAIDLVQPRGIGYRRHLLPRDVRRAIDIDPAARAAAP